MLQAQKFQFVNTFWIFAKQQGTQMLCAPLCKSSGNLSKKYFSKSKTFEKSQNFCKVARYVAALLPCVNLQKCALLCKNVATWSPC
jgi:hypothetical protein